MGTAFSLAACATGPAFVELESPRNGEAAVYVYRLSALGGAAITHTVSFDGVESGVLVNGSYLRQVTTTDHPVRVRAGNCAPAAEELRLRAGEIAFVQAQLISGSFDLGGRHYFDYHCRLVRRTEAEALPALLQLRRSQFGAKAGESSSKVSA